MAGAAVLLDRDGVLVRGPQDGAPSPLATAADVSIYPDALRAVEILRDLEVPFAIVSNQGDVGRGRLTVEALQETHEAMVAQLGGPILAYYCMHDPDADCACRKPRPRNLLRALTALEAEVALSFMIGDWTSDWQAARSIGVLPLLVLTGRGPKARDGFRIAMGQRVADLLTFPTVLDAVSFAIDAMNHDLEKNLGLHGIR